MNHEVYRRMQGVSTDNTLSVESLPSVVRHSIDNTTYGYFVSRCRYNGIDVFNLKDLNQINDIIRLFDGKLKDIILNWKDNLTHAVKYFGVNKFKFVFKH